MWYKLVDKEPVPCKNFDEYLKFSEVNHPIRVGHTTYSSPELKIRVSTVFLGLDLGSGDPPIVFETMIFGGDHDQYQERYSTWEEAYLGHANAVQLVQKELEEQGISFEILKDSSNG